MMSMFTYDYEAGRWRRVNYDKDGRVQVNKGWVERFLTGTATGRLKHSRRSLRIKDGPELVTGMKCPKRIVPLLSSNKTNGIYKKYKNKPFRFNTSSENNNNTAHKNPIRLEDQNKNILDKNQPNKIKSADKGLNKVQTFDKKSINNNMWMKENIKDEVIRKVDRLSLSNKSVTQTDKLNPKSPAFVRTVLTQSDKLNPTSPTFVKPVQAQSDKLNPKSPAFVKTVQKAITEDSDSSYETEHEVKELVITDEMVSLLRRFLKKNKVDIDLQRFDTDDYYKRLVFSKISPLVQLERCPMITKLLAKKKCEKNKAKSNKKDSESKVKREKWIHMTSSSEDSGSLTTDHIGKSKKHYSPPPKKNAMVFLPKDFRPPLRKKSSSLWPKKKQHSPKKTKQREPSTSTSDDFQVKKDSTRVRPKRFTKTTKRTTRKRAVNSEDKENDSKIVRELRSTRPARSATTKEPLSSASEDFQLSSTRVQPRRSTNTTTKNWVTYSEDKDKTEDKSDRELRSTRPARSGTTKVIINSEDKEKDKSDRELRSTRPARSGTTKIPLTNNQKTNRKPVKVPKRSSVAPGRAYSSLEDHAIIAWLDKAQERQRLVSGNAIWKNLQDDYINITHVKRSWQSLRSRYLRYILPSIWNLGLPTHQVQRLLANYGTGDLRQNKKRRNRNKPTDNSLLVLPTIKSASSRTKPTKVVESDATVIYKKVDEPLPLRPAKRLLRSNSFSPAVIASITTAAAVQPTTDKQRAQTKELQASPRLRKRAADDNQQSPNVVKTSLKRRSRSLDQRATDSSPSYSEITKRFAMRLRSTPQNSGSSATTSPVNVEHTSPPTRKGRRLFNQNVPWRS